MGIPNDLAGSSDDQGSSGEIRAGEIRKLQERVEFLTRQNHELWAMISRAPKPPPLTSGFWPKCSSCNKNDAAYCEECLSYSIRNRTL